MRIPAALVAVGIRRVRLLMATIVSLATTGIRIVIRLELASSTLQIQPHPVHGVSTTGAEECDQTGYRQTTDNFLELLELHDA